MTLNKSTPQETYHSAHLTYDPARQILWQVLTDYLARYVSPDAGVLELGAGYCYWINQVNAARKVAIDIWPEFPHYAAPEVETVLYDLSLGLEILGDQRFNVVMASNLLEHFEPDITSQLIADVFAHLQVGGRFIVIQPNFRYAYRRYFDDYTHRAIFTDVSLPNLMRLHGFYIEKVQAKFMPYSLQGSRIPIKPWLIRAYLSSPFKPLAGQMLVVAQKPANQ